MIPTICCACGNRMAKGGDYPPSGKRDARGNVCVPCATGLAHEFPGMGFRDFPVRMSQSLNEGASIPSPDTFSPPRTIAGMDATAGKSLFQAHPSGRWKEAKR